MHCVSGVQTKVEKGSPGAALTCSKGATQSLGGWKGRGRSREWEGKARSSSWRWIALKKYAVKGSGLLLSCLGLWSKAFFYLFFCAREYNYWFSKKKKCSSQRIQTALISSKIHTAGLGLFKRHCDESVSCASPIFSFILISFSPNVVLSL